MIRLRRFLFGALALVTILLTSGCTPFAPHTLTVETQRHAEAWTRALSDVPLRQTFILPPDATVSEIELVLALPEGAPVLPTRPLGWSLVGSSNTAIRDGVIETASLPHNTPVQITFDSLPRGESVELALTAPPGARLALWRTVEDRYPQGTLIDTPPVSDSDLTFVLRALETPRTIGATLASEAHSWERIARWLPLILLAPGWLLLWLLGNGEGRPRAAAAVGLSLALVPVMYLWFGLANVHLYLPLARSLLNVAAALTLFIAVRRWRWLWRAWREIPIGAMTLLTAAIILCIASWLLAAREYLAPPGTDMLESGLLAQAISDNGLVPLPAPPLPPAALTAFLSTISQEDVGNLLIFSGLVLAVAALPALFAFAEEITEQGEVAVWLLPLPWLWQGLWNAVATGDWFVLYSYAVMPVAFAMGVRALRAEGQRRRALFLAAVPLGGLFLVQGVNALLTWALAVGTAFFLIALRNRETGRNSDGAEHNQTPLHAVVPRGVAWLFLGVTLLAPTLTQRLPVIAPPPRTLFELGYDYLLVALMLALGLRALRSVLKPVIHPAYVVVAFVLLVLTWSRSAPLPPAALSLQPEEQSVLAWMGGLNTPDNSLPLINLDIRAGAFVPSDGTFWSPLFNRRHTVYSDPPEETALIRRAFAPGALEDGFFRDELRSAGITHVLLGASSGPLSAGDVKNQEWARTAYESSGAYLFELVSSDPTAQ